jgi:hypothetical protein
MGIWLEAEAAIAYVDPIEIKMTRDIRRDTTMRPIQES